MELNYPLFFIILTTALISEKLFISNYAWYEKLLKPHYHLNRTNYSLTWFIMYFLAFVSTSRSLNLHDFPVINSQVFVLQISLKLLWLYLFYIEKNILGALGVAILLLIATLTHFILMIHADTAAPIIFLPFVFWIFYIVVLNYHIYKLN